MTRAIALFLALLLIAVPLAGCTGDDTSSDDDSSSDGTELNDANERIAELEAVIQSDQTMISALVAQAEVDQARIADLEEDLDELCCTLEEMAVQYQYCLLYTSPSPRD